MILDVGLCVYALALFVNEKNEILLSYRENTKFFEHHFGLIGGKIESNESTKSALARELQEELGIQVLPENMEFKHVMHFKGERIPCMFFIFAINQWQGDLTNRELDKNAELAWFPWTSLPENIIPRHLKALQLMQQNVMYSESNW